MESGSAQLDRWLREVTPKAVAYARTLVHDPETAEDLVQDVLCRLLDHPEYDLLREGEKILFRSLSNACINAVTRRRQVRSLESGRQSGSRSNPGLCSEAPDPAQAVATRDTMSVVREELARLPEMQRAAVELKAMGKSLKEIAATLEVSRSNAGVLIHRGRKKLRRRLGELLPGELQ